MKRVIVILAALFVSVSVFAQETPVAEKTFWDDPFNSPMLPVYVVMAFVFAVLVLVAFVAFYMIRILNMLTTQAVKERAEKLGILYVPRPTWWNSFVQKMNASVPVTEEKNIELDHNYDGIKELDNHLPPWWKWLFYGTIGWAAIYLVVFHISNSLPLSLGEYQQEVALADEQARKLKASRPLEEINEESLAFSKDSTSFIMRGKDVFLNSNCGSCHRPDGGGNTIGPNLTDDHWLHGDHIRNVFSTIKNGVVEKGMPAWGKALSPQQVRDVTFYVMSLQGTNPVNAKAPQGTLYKKETTAPADSLKTQASL